MLGGISHAIWIKMYFGPDTKIQDIMPLVSVRNKHDILFIWGNPANHGSGGNSDWQVTVSFALAK